MPSRVERHEFNRLVSLLEHLSTTTWSPQDIDTIQRSVSSSLFFSYLKWLCTLNKCYTKLRNALIQEWFSTLIEQQPSACKVPLTPGTICSHPMCLQELVHYTWKYIDELALANSWWSEKSSQRYEAFVEHVVFDTCKKHGHTYITLPYFESTWHEQREHARIPASYGVYLKALIKKNLVYVHVHDTSRNGQWIVPVQYKNEEESIVSGVLSMSKRLHCSVDVRKESFACRTLTDEQWHAIVGLLNEPISILTGKGGTGKTCCVVKSVIEKLRETNIDFVLLSPTHAAKKNALCEIETFANQTVHASHYQTIHSYTHAFPLASGEDAPREAHIQWTTKLEQRIWSAIEDKRQLHVFVEESSMIDRKRFSLLMTICAKYDCVRLTMLGDPNQLPAIGAGQIFADLIRSRRLPTFHLTRNFRAEKSDIPAFCDMILGESEYGKHWKLEKNKVFQDVHYHFAAGLPLDQVESLLQDYCAKGYLPVGLAEDSTLSLQIITNTNKTCGMLVPSVRKVFYKALRYASNDVVSFQKYATDDPVLLCTNCSIFKNGDHAKIVEMHTEDGFKTEYTLQLTPCDNERDMSKKDQQTFHWSCVDGIETVVVHEQHIKPLFARTVHSTQGLGFDCVLYVIDTTFPLNMNMHYTAFSRAKKALHLVGSREHFNGRKAVSYTHLRAHETDS